MPLASLHDCRCTVCGGARLVSTLLAWDDAAILDGAIRCEACEATYDAIWGIPFLGHYDSDDILGLIEIAANARADNLFASRADVVRIERLLAGYHDAPDKAAFVAASSDEYARAPWFSYRYTEYLHFTTVSDGVDFDGLDVLDVGAGSGYDTVRLVLRGARVTAIEYNPVLATRGRSTAPEARWIGGFSHVLPFADASFDAVCCNAALHHMRNVPAAISEMLRVLRPGGLLLTTGDPFSSESSTEDLEFEIFNEHEAVLLGVNESIPRFPEIAKVLIEKRSDLEIGFLTSTLYGFRETALSLPRDIFDLRWWPVDMHIRLAKAAGTVAMRVRVTGAPKFDVPLQGPCVLRAGAYAEVLADFEAAISSLAKLLPQQYVDRTFPGSSQTKFELLNGWQAPKPGLGFRIAYRRARWFLSKPSGADRLSFGVRRLVLGKGYVLDVLVNGRPAAASLALADDLWNEVEAHIDTIDDGDRFVLELRIRAPDSANASFKDYQFAVRDRSFR